MPVKYIPNKRIIEMFADIPYFWTVGPFQPTGGWLAPIYGDLRKSFTKPGNIGIMADEVIKLIRKEKIKFDIICGGVTAGMPVATLVSHKLKKPFIYVRKEKKKGGLGVAVEGNWRAYKKGARVLLIDDAYANGTSKKHFINNIRELGLTIKHVITIGRRGSPGGNRWTDTMKVTAYTFFSIKDIIDRMLEKKKISKQAHLLLTWYFQYPNKWHKDPKKKKILQEYYRTHKKGSHKV